ncbi:MAG: hypothetical protein QOH11_1886 [Solirubrobacteraceae bacterium]|jgi:hypothetical protein|nr:hypothetical protein [Solirubrobacteraceae bacterium]
MDSSAANCTVGAEARAGTVMSWVVCVTREAALEAAGLRK